MERVDDTVFLILTNRYGERDDYEFPVADAVQIARALFEVCHT